MYKDTLKKLEYENGMLLRVTVYLFCNLTRLLLVDQERRTFHNLRIKSQYSLNHYGASDLLTLTEDNQISVQSRDLPVIVFRDRDYLNIGFGVVT